MSLRKAGCLALLGKDYAMNKNNITTKQPITAETAVRTAFCLRGKRCGAGLANPVRRVFSGWRILLTAVFCLFGTASAQAQSEEELYKQAVGYHQAQDWARSISSLESFIKTYPDSKYRSAAELYLGHSYLARNDFVNVQDGITGRSHLNYIIEKGKNADFYREASLQNAFSFFSLMMYDQALPALEKFVAEFPDSTDLQFALYYLGVTYSNLGRYTDALNSLTQCIEKYPAGQLKDQCLLEKALALGRSGEYSQADRELQRLAMDAAYPFRQKATLMRAALCIVQDKYTDANLILDSILRENITDDALYIEANQYQAYCYMQQGQYDQALASIDKIQARGNLSPDSAFLKIKILTKMGRFDDAQAILEQIRRLEYSLYGSDAINYYQATIYLAQGKWDEAINLLVSFLNISQDPNNKSGVVFNYFNNTSGVQNKLRPRDFLDACGTLVLSLVSRYATSRFDADNTNQQAVFNAMYQYAVSQPDPYLMTIVTQVDKQRQSAFSSPIGANYRSGGTGTPAAGNLVVNSGGGIASNPANPGQPGQLPQQGQPGQVGTNPAGGLNTGGTAANTGAVPAAGGTAETKKYTSIEANTIYNNAQSLFQSGKYEQANETLLKLLTSSDTFWEDCPNVAAASALLRANTLFKMKRFDEAQTMCTTLVKQAPNSAQAADANYYLGFWADYYNHSEAAIEYFQKVIESPYEGRFRDRAYYGLGWNEWERRNTIQAEKYFRKIYRDYNDSTYWGHAAWAVAMIEYKNQNYQASERIVNDALSQHPDKTIVDRLLFLKGEIALKIKDYPKARVAFNTIMTHCPDSPLEREAQGRLDSLPKADSTAPETF